MNSMKFHVNKTKQRPLDHHKTSIVVRGVNPWPTIIETRMRFLAHLVKVGIICVITHVSWCSAAKLQAVGKQGVNNVPGQLIE